MSREDREIRFNGAELTPVTVQASKAIKGDELIYSLLGAQGQLSAWPAIAAFGDNHQAKLYVQTENDLTMQAKLYDSVTETGYFLSGTVDPSANPAVLDLGANMAELQVASGMQGAQLDVQGDLKQEDRYAKRYFVSKGANVTAACYVESDGYRYTFTNQVGKVERDVTLGIGHDFRNMRTKNQVFEAGEVNKRVYTDYRDEMNNALADISNVEIAKIGDRVETTGIVFTVEDAMKEEAMTVQTNGEGEVAYEPADPNVSTLAAGSILDYQIYDSSNQAVGDSLQADTPELVEVGTPLLEGDYALKLAKQNFLTNVVRLSGQSNISIYEDKTSYSEISVELPPGYAPEDLAYGQAELQSQKDGSLPGYVWFNRGKLIIPNDIDLSKDRKYVLHLALYLDSTSGERDLYYNQAILTGEELMNLKEVSYPSSAVAIEPEADDLPVDYYVAFVQADFPVAGFDNSYRAYVQAYGANGSIKVGKVIFKPQQFDMLFQGSNGASTAYALKRNVRMADATGKWSMQNPGIHHVQLQGKQSFVGFNAQNAGSDETSIYFESGTGVLFNEAYVSPGNYRLFITTESGSSDDEPWSLYWRSRSAYRIDKDTVVPFTGSADPASSSLRVTQRLEEGRVVLTVDPTIRSGDLELQEVLASHKGYYNYVPGIVTVRDSGQRKVYEALAMDSNEGFEISKTLADGTYSISFSQPVGPNKDIAVSNSFTVVSTGVVPGGGGGGGGGGFPGGGIPPVGGNPAQPESPTTMVFKTADIPAPRNGIVSLQIKASEAAVLPASILGGEGAKNAIQLEGEHGAVTIPAAVLQQLSGLVGREQLDNAQVSMSLMPVTDSELSAALNTTTGTAVQSAGKVYDFKLSITGKDGISNTLALFDEPITLSFDVNPEADKRLTNVYYIAEAGTLTYVPAQRVGDRLVAKVSHFSKYGVLEVRRAFVDVNAAHWARGAIEELASKQIVSGVSSNAFAPNKSVSRAEFTAMLVQALGLTADPTSEFKDVPASAWYGATVAAAYKHGLVQGVSADSFAPNKPVTREEMAVILVNARKKLDLGSLSSSAASFRDSAKISGWAAEAVDIANANGLIRGDARGFFNPKGMATRAEAAQVLANMLHENA
ncbi:S-layer homology domain-containing protein [Paenibacillus methanolicus]|uniref:S-layer family protein n=1 Tax=Paenibacillus methanolicus TaxID=582686 RepID=A0A5S5BYI1_9BACL|nr:S-layer homology domain-containing protein [Paenibacillus methanolicus]TYP72097.1 S-layer family protein [Paenibacillus methanolicus]